MPSLRMGMTALRNKPPEFRTARMIAGIIAVQRARAQSIIRQLSQYPAETDNQTYVRTGDLAAGWNIKPTVVNTNSIVTEYENDAVDERGRYYARYVYGTRDREQAWMHVGRWPRAYDKEIQDTAQYRKDLAGVIRRSIVF